ncbi:MAG: DUF4359 domain-containing protein [Cyanobacteria bacterium P01_G01_bin.67]
MALKNIGMGGVIVLAIGAIALATNPGEQKYQEYANTTIQTKLKDKVCTQVAEDLGIWIEGQCQILITTAGPYLADAINQQTTKHNFLLFSIYQADLSLPQPLPEYRLQTLGILGNFYIYQAQKL